MKRIKAFIVVSVIVVVLCAVAWVIWRRNDQKIPLPRTIPAVCNGESFAGEVVSVSDGDTVDVMRDGAAARIRLHNIDTPEKGQAFGRRAKAFTSDLAFHKIVTVCVVDRDRYGRLVADVTLPDGRSLNRELVPSVSLRAPSRCFSERARGIRFWPMWKAATPQPVSASHSPMPRLSMLTGLRS